jgi:hypothetical protein
MDAGCWMKGAAKASLKGDVFKGTSSRHVLGALVGRCRGRYLAYRDRNPARAVAETEH